MTNSDHWDLGYAHARDGQERYKFQDPHLQAEYDKGWRCAERDYGVRIEQKRSDHHYFKIKKVYPDD